MKLNVLHYFVVLAEELHFGRAAERLAMTQPPLSLAIKTLEDELGVALFVRTNKMVKLSTAGAAFLEEARQILLRVERAKSITQAMAAGIKGRLDIAVTGSLLYRDLPEIFDDFQASSPDVELQIMEMSTKDQLEALNRNRIHAGFLHTASVPPSLVGLPLRNDDFVLCMPEQDPRASMARVHLKDFADDRFIMFVRDVSPASHDNVIALLNRAGVHPRSVHAVKQWMTSIAMVGRGMGLALVPRSLSRTAMAGVKFLPLADVQGFSPAHLLWNPTDMPETLARFLRTATRVLTDGQACHTAV